jgi:hypothetical protein
LGKDFTRDTIEVIVRGAKGGFVGLAANDYEYYRRGASTFVRKEDVMSPSFVTSYIYCALHRVSKVVKELMSYTQPADLPFVQTWHHNDARWEDSIFFSAPTTGMDTFTTIEVLK